LRWETAGLTGATLSTPFIRGILKIPCRAIIEEMHFLFRDPYLYIQARDIPETQSTIEEMRSEDTRVHDAHR
jgi:hypothetical protein